MTYFNITVAINTAEVIENLINKNLQLKKMKPLKKHRIFRAARVLNVNVDN